LRSPPRWPCENTRRALIVCDFKELHDKHAALVSIGRYLGMFDDKVKVDAVYGISEEPMSAEEWNKQFAKAG
jgi:hypothetical protein